MKFKYGMKVLVIDEQDHDFRRVGFVHMIQENHMIGVVFPEDIGISKRTRRRAITNITQFTPDQIIPETEYAS